MSMVVDVREVSMRFCLNQERVDSLKEYIIRRIKRDLHYDVFWALTDISVQVKKGENLGIIGLNGSGKSTLLKIIAGVLKPTKGSVAIKGEMAPLIELGAGFDSLLTARENIFLNGAILGHNRAFMQERFDDIIRFAELEEFVDVPVNNFSSGMTARLGFSIATLVRPEILIVDEILSVGDYKFQQKCKDRMKEMMGEGTTVLYVGHGGILVREICDKVLWLERGHIREYGDADDVVSKYEDGQNSEIFSLKKKKM